MNDDSLRNLFASLATLTENGPIPVQAYSMLAGKHSAESLAEHMRIRWLSDGRFGPIAANIVMHIHKMESGDLALSSCVLALLLNDYRHRLAVRNDSRLMFRNSVKTLFAMYPVYQKMDECVSKCFIKPLFCSLDALIDDDPDTDDLETGGALMVEYGRALSDINSYLVDGLIVKMRQRLVSDDAFVTRHIRELFLHAADLWAFGWSELNVPECLIAGGVNWDHRLSVGPLLGLVPANDAPPRKNDIVFGSKESVV